jgi:hypothetical protein
VEDNEVEAAEVVEEVNKAMKTRSRRLSSASTAERKGIISNPARVRREVKPRKRCSKRSGRKIALLAQI